MLNFDIYIIKNYKHYFIITILLLFVSCGLKPIESNYQYIDTEIENINLDDLGNGKILIHNGANVFHKIDETSSLNIWINNIPAGQLKASEYVVIRLNEGSNIVRLLHKDVVNMKSEHNIVIDERTKIIMVKPTITSNKLEVTNEFPRNWHKFSYKSSQ